jgi:hypothetical protein
MPEEEHKTRVKPLKLTRLKLASLFWSITL